MLSPVVDSVRLNAALTTAQAAIDRLIETANSAGLDGLRSLPSDQLLGFAVSVERLRNRMLVLDRPIVTALEAGRVAEQQLMRSTARLLEDRLLITRGEARRRVAVVEACAPRTAMTGEPMSARHPVLAEAQNHGLVSQEQTTTILTGLDKIEKLVGLRPDPDDPEGIPVGPDDVERAEQTLVGRARLFCGSDLAAIAGKIIDVLHPDGDPDLTEAQERSRGLHLQRLSTGLVRIQGDLLPETAQAVRAVLTPLARPARGTAATDGFDVSHSGGAEPVLDDRTREQRWHDALDSACRRLLTAGGLPVAGGVPATVIVTIDEAALRTRTGCGITPDGTRLPIGTVLRIGDQAQIIPTVLSATGEVLEQGRSRRIASTAQTLALYARDGGCSFPGCDHPPDWCERHHITSWADGGNTDLDNLTLLCGYHHRRFETHGWTCQLIGGLPHWTAPPERDPDQVPQLHERLRGKLADAANRRASSAELQPLIASPTGSVAESFCLEIIRRTRLEILVADELHGRRAA